MNKTVVRPNNSHNLPSYQAKVNILKQIDDAASQIGGKHKRQMLNELNALRNADAKQAAQLVLQGGRKDGLSAADLQNINSSNMRRGMFDHKRTLRQGEVAEESRRDDLRSLKSEYDYGARKKFVDILGNIKKKSGLEGLPSKNIDTTSIKSGMSIRTGKNSLKSITNSEFAAAKREPEAVVYDEKGEPVQLTS